jgi:predicted NBD/HSP70 family sugar kinase
MYKGIKHVTCVSASKAGRCSKTSKLPRAGPIVSPLDVRAADDNKDSLAKMVYSRMFDWLVAKINTAIGQDPDALALVGVLDIYGDTSPPPLSFLRLSIKMGLDWGKSADVHAPWECLWARLPPLRLVTEEEQGFAVAQNCHEMQLKWWMEGL